MEVCDKTLQGLDVHNVFSPQSEALSKEVATTEMTLKTTSSEVKDVKSQLQALEIELQSQLSMVSHRNT